MKKIKVLVYAIAISFTAFSCNDAIEIVQDGEVTQEVAFQKVSDLESFLLGNVYTSIDPSNEIQLGSIFTDETAITPMNPGHYFEIFRYVLQTSTGQVAGTWATHYRTINRVNRLIEAVPLVTVNPGEEAELNSILAEARAVRAYSYLQLLSYFSPNMKDNNALGVILSTSVPEIDAKLPRVSNGEIYAQIEADLNFAEANLSSLATNYKFVTLPMINAVRARMYTYRGMYTEAKQYAQAVINASPGLTPATPYIPASFGNNPYRQIWTDAAQQEVIFALSRPSVGTWGNIASLWTTNTTDIGGTPLMGIGFNLFNIISEPGDIRGKAFVDETSSSLVKVIDKYPGKANTVLRNDIKIFRTSEMYFILAEAAVYENQLSTAAQYIQQVRNARKYTAGSAPLPVYVTQVDGYRDILRERRAELCFEGHRYVDLRRLGATAGVSIDRNPQDDYFSSSTPLTLPITDHRFTFPIPAIEVLGNPNIQQNPNY